MALDLLRLVTLLVILGLVGSHGYQQKTRRDTGRNPQKNIDTSDLVRISDIVTDWPENCKVGMQALIGFGEMQSPLVYFDWLLVLGVSTNHSQFISEALGNLELPKVNRMSFGYRYSLLNRYCKKLGQNKVHVNGRDIVALQIAYTMLKVHREHKPEEETKILPANFKLKVEICRQFITMLNSYNRIHYVPDLIDKAKEYEMLKFHRVVSNEKLCTKGLRHVLRDTTYREGEEENFINV